MTVIYLGEPTGPRLRKLSLEQEKALDNWLTNALKNPPSKRDPLPVDFTRALSALAKRRGIRFYFNGDQMRVRGEIVLGKNVPGCIGGTKRKVVARDERQAVAKAGPKVAPYHERPWRDDYL
ncbi:hypothetical protein SEQ_HALENA_44 [Mycobacterium phage Halena]|uniref:Uncharacterized protein n=10 Tax=Bronvirus TaxID=1623278 RepID=E0YPH8_9CAUD|nr:hypothetical protein LEBRON_45 [Mycobacterium phage LeBron]YP_009635889.1 hypothetical protein FGG55_gp044 [Mycobacterium phage JoeDirt]YP_010100941.1 hypothetical protein KNU44_gp045 [Mycobacterium phage CicholasNage]YP_010101350.1 hypothetical protein KNU48_gp115 [Mycobacterium phage Silverleaf]YP_010105446.1 hypothetical protein KNU85_gp044 [Mycobacterium phage DirkDirk]YP_010114744.1 hypothetical protein KNV76_gp044 [Mycobacterium phage OhShagHennessy]AEK07580.1 hypothetical protein UP